MDGLSGMLANILTDVHSMSDYYAREMAMIAVALAFVMSTVRLMSEIFTRGYDQFGAYFRDQLKKFMIIVFLTLPLPGLGGGSFISAFPALVIKGGITTANSFVKDAAPKELGGGGELLNMPADLRTKIKNIRNIDETAIKAALTQLQNDNSALYKLSWVDEIWVKIVAAIIMILFTAPFLILLPLLGNVWGNVFSVIWQFSFLMSLSVTGHAQGQTINIQSLLGGFSGGDGISRQPGAIVQLISAVADFAFVTALTFSFFGVLLSCVVKAVIMIITFPISVVTMAFEQQRQVFISNIARAFSIALTPIVAATVFAICLAAYSHLTASGGLVSKMVDTYIGAGTATNFDDFGALFFRWLVAMFLAPVVLCFPVVRYMVKVPQIVQELIGVGVGYGSGLSERWSGVGFGTKKIGG